MLSFYKLKKDSQLSSLTVGMWCFNDTWPNNVQYRVCFEQYTDCCLVIAEVSDRLPISE